MKAIILDFDGLILDTETPLYRSSQEVCEHHGVHMDHAWWAVRLTAHSEPPEAYALLEEHSIIPIDRDQLHRARSARELQLIAEQKLLPGVLEVIAQARSLSLRIGMASNSERAWVTGHLSRLDLLQVFDQIKCRDVVASPKDESRPVPGCPGSSGCLAATGNWCGFLYNQVRNMAGTLNEIGRGHWDVDCVPRILETKDRRHAGPTAPARGLTLVEVRYGERIPRNPGELPPRGA